MLNTWISKYRIKTEKEFIQEFGKEYYNKIDWVQSMDYMFGRKLNELKILSDEVINEQNFLEFRCNSILVETGFHIDNRMIIDFVKGRREKLINIR